MGAVPEAETPADLSDNSAIGRPWVALCGVQLVGHGVDRDGELLAHAPAEVAGVERRSGGIRRERSLSLPHPL
jgi:hypothetical protein